MPWLLTSDKIALAGTMVDGLGGLITVLAQDELLPAIASAFGVAATIVRYLYN